MQGVGYELHAMQSYLLTNISQHEKIQLYKTWKDEEKVMCTVITNSSIDKFIPPKNIQPGRCIKLYTLRKINSTYIKEVVLYSRIIAMSNPYFLCLI